MFKKAAMWIAMVFVLMNIDLSAQAATDEASGLEYEVLEDGTVEITGYSGSAAEVVIPEEIEGKTVTSIGMYSLAQAKITSIELPETITNISEGAFFDSDIASFEWPEELDTIEEYVFGFCDNLTAIHIPQNVTKIGATTFSGCNALETITVDENNTVYMSENNIIYSKDKTTLFHCGAGIKLVEVPSGVTYIGERAFENCVDVEKVILPESVVEIGMCAFSGASALTKIELPESLEKIGIYAFSRTGLKKMHIPAGVTSIGQGAFSMFTGEITVDSNNGYYLAENNILFNKDKTELIRYGGNEQEVVVGEGVEFIGEEAFASTVICNVTLPSTLKEIGFRGFYDCGNLQEITIPKNVQEIRGYAFDGCENLAKIIVLNKDCYIARSEIADAYGNRVFPVDAVLYGYVGSTTEEYAEDFERQFEAISDKELEVLNGRIQLYSFEDLIKVLAEKTLEESICADYVGEEDLVIKADITIPKNVQLYSYEKAVIVPVGVTLSMGDTYGSCLSAGTLDIQGMLVADGYVYVKDALKVTGALQVNSNIAISGNAKLTGADKITFANDWKKIVWKYYVDTMAELKEAVAVASECTESHYAYDISTQGNGELLIDESLTIPSNANFQTVGSYTVTIGVGCQLTLTTPTDLSSPMKICGILNNKSRLNVYQWSGGSLTLAEGGLYEGVGSISVHANDETAFKKALSGFDLTKCDVTAGINNWVVEVSAITNEGETNTEGDEETDTEIQERIEFQYEVLEDGTLEITGYTNSANYIKELIIPTEIDGKTVSSIGEFAFEGKHIDVVSIPQTVKTIKKGAFYNGTLKEIVIPKSVEVLGENVFGQCADLVSIQVEDGNPNYIVEDSILYTKDKKTLVRSEIDVTKVEVPEGVEIIAGSAFCHAVALQEVTLPNTVTSIGVEAFFNCQMLPKIDIPDSVESIGLSAFFDCKSLAGELKLPKNLKTIGMFAFYNCDKLTGELILPEGLTGIGDYAFTRCSGFTGDLVIPQSVTTIGNYAFVGCNGMNPHVYITEGTTDIVGSGVQVNGIMDENGNYQYTPDIWKQLTIHAPKDSYAEEFALSKGYQYEIWYDFEDVTENTYYEEPVEWAVAKGITNGYGSTTTFCPDNVCTRGQIVTFLWRAKGCPEPVSLDNPFTDVATDAYYYKAVLWAVEQGITNGYGSDTIFNPDGECTRGQVATFMWRAEGNPANSGSNPFVDLQDGAYYYGAVLWAVEKGVTNGYGNADTFCPDVICTRGQIVTFLYRGMN